MTIIGSISSFGNLKSISKSSNTIASGVSTINQSSNIVQCGSCGGSKMQVGDAFIYTGALIGSIWVSVGTFLNNVFGKGSSGGCGCN